MMDNTAGQNESGGRIHYIPEWAAKREKQPGDIVNFTGADKSLVSRWLKGTLPKGRYLNSLAQLFDIPVSDLFVDPATKEAEIGSDVSLEGLMPVDGYAAASTWQELDDLGQEPKEWIPFGRDPDYAQRRQYAVEVRGNSMDKVVRPGECAIVVEAFGQAPRDGDIVLVRRIRGHLVERTIKRYRETSRGAVFMPESTDSRHEPLPATGDGETVVEIEAFVIGYYGRIKR
jgi:SOS-response transcriptional repressor LexA